MSVFYRFRNDDVSRTTSLELLQRCHALFKQHNKIHTVGVIMENLWDNKEIWYWLQWETNLEIGLHGWTHRDYSQLTEQECVDDIRRALEYWKTYSARGGYRARTVRVFLPPWNHVSPALEAACRQTGLILDARVGPPVYNFHSWACQNPAKLANLEKTLRE